MRFRSFRAAMILLSVMTAVSCSSSRYQGFSYRPAQQGPDISGDLSANTGQEQATTIISTPETEHLQPVALNERLAPEAELARMVETEVETRSLENKTDTRELVRSMAETYSEEKNIQLTAKQWRKLDRYAAKLEKKQQKMAEVEWGPQNNLELFVLAAAVVGIVVGLFSSFGWVVFLIAALVYLYLKLLKN